MNNNVNNWELYKEIVKYTSAIHKPHNFCEKHELYLFTATNFISAIICLCSAAFRERSMKFQRNNSCTTYLGFWVN